MNDKKHKKYLIIFIVLVVCCFLYLGAKATYTSYESVVDGNAKTDIAKIKLKVNGIDVVSNNDGTLNNNVILNNITWDSTHTREGKLSPGSHGTIDLELDATGSEVAILYEFRFIDKLIDEDKLLTFSNITSSNNITRTAVDTYTGVLTLDDINNGVKPIVSVDFFFDYLDDIEGITEDNQVLDDLFEIHLHVLQYRGETITEYTG